MVHINWLYLGKEWSIEKNNMAYMNVYIMSAVYAFQNTMPLFTF